MFSLLFPGQGSQRPGMGRSWESNPSWAVVEELSQALGRNLARLLLDAEEDELRETRNAQLAAYTLSLVVLDGMHRGPLNPSATAVPVAVAGHSLGEYTALVAAGALDAAGGARLVQARAEAMHAASEANPGTMAAVLGLDMATVANLCEQFEGIWVANDNAPGQVVIAGTLGAVERTATAVLDRGAKRVISLRVGGAFHTPLMHPAQAQLDAALQEAAFSSPRCPVVSNVDAQPHLGSFGPLLSAQLCSQVRWRESLLSLERAGARLFVELGPGTELSGMARRTVPGAARISVATPEGVEALGEALRASARAIYDPQ